MNTNHAKLQCKQSGEIFIVVREYLGEAKGHIFRAVSLNGYLSEAYHNEWESFVTELERTEEVQLEIIEG